MCRWITGIDLNCRKIRHIILDQCFSIVQTDGNTCSISTPFIIAIPKITQSKEFNFLSFPWMPEPIKIPGLTLQGEGNKRHKNHDSTLQSPNALTRISQKFPLKSNKFQTLLRNWDVASGVIQSRKRSRFVFVEPLPKIMILEMEKQTSKHSERRLKEEKKKKRRERIKIFFYFHSLFLILRLKRKMVKAQKERKQR